MATKRTKTITTGVMVDGTYDHIVWKIQNWVQVQLDKQKLENQQFEFEAGEDSPYPSKWLIGLKVINNNTFGAKFRLLESKSTLSKISLKAIVQSKRGDGTLYKTYNVDQPLLINQEATTAAIFSFNLPEQNWSSCLDADKALTLEIKLETGSIETGVLHAHTTNKKSMESFEKAFTSKLQKSYGELLTDSSSSDTKIVSSDGKEFAVHSVVLKAQCPMFRSMLSPESQFSERETGRIEVKDVSGKTMEILLRYFYTGELLPAWRDADTILEFSYAAGKYQMTEVLVMLDEMIGMPEDSDATCNMQFLSLVNKLGLKNAERRVVKRTTKQTAAAETQEDLFKILECSK